MAAIESRVFGAFVVFASATKGERKQRDKYFLSTKVSRNWKTPLCLFEVCAYESLGTLRKRGQREEPLARRKGYAECNVTRCKGDAPRLQQRLHEGKIDASPAIVAERRRAEVGSAGPNPRDRRETGGLTHSSRWQLAL